ncbi:phospholipase-like protein [Tanacetum coccineum]
MAVRFLPLRTTSLWVRVVNAIHGEEGSMRFELGETSFRRNGNGVRNIAVDILSDMLGKKGDWNENSCPNVSSKTRWVKYVPIKVNILAWKVKMEALPVRFNLSRRGIDIGSIVCPVCESEVETASHLFFKCSLLRQIARKVSSWWNVDYVGVNSYEEWFDWLGSLRLPAKLKLMLEGVFYVEYPVTIHVRSKLRLFQLLKDRLNEDRRTLFKTTCFGPWLDIIYVENDDGMIHYVLQKQCCSDDDNFDLPLIYHVNSHSLHFGRREFCLLTGFEFGSISFREYRNGDIPFRNRLFPEKIGYVKIIDLFALFDDEEKFSKLSDEDAIRLCLLLSLEVIFMGRELVSVVDDVYLRMVNDLDAWNSFPWGEHIWRQLYDSIRNVSSKHKLEHFLSYSLTGFLFAFKAPIELAPTKDEVQCNWYAPSNDYFMWYVPRKPPVSIGGLYGEYMNKISAARAARKKSSEDFHPSECVREASLIDRVSTFYPSRVVEKQEILKKVVLQIEDYLQSTSEDEQDIKDHTSPKQDDGNVYCCDDNGDVPLFFMPAKLVNQQTDQDISSDLSVLNGLCNLSQTREEKGDCELAIERCVPKKRKYVDVLRSPLCALPEILNVPNIEQLANQKNVLNPLMIEKCKFVKPWVEDLSRPFKRIDKNFFSHELRLFLSRAVVGRCKFPWSNDITVYRSFLPLLLQGSMLLFYANNDIYQVPWSNVERVFIPINEPLRHWSLAMFHICSGVVTFYDSERIEGGEYRKWCLQMRDCLEEKIHVVLKETGVFEKKNIDPAKYKISFKVADGVPKHCGVFGDCGVFLCMLANGIPLALDDPLQSALAYREKLIHFYFKHKMFCP